MTKKYQDYSPFPKKDFKQILDTLLQTDTREHLMDDVYKELGNVSVKLGPDSVAKHTSKLVFDALERLGFPIEFEIHEEDRVNDEPESVIAFFNNSDGGSTESSLYGKKHKRNRIDAIFHMAATWWEVVGDALSKEIVKRREQQEGTHEYQQKLRLYKRIEQHIEQIKFGVVKDGVMRFLRTDTEIPLDLLMYQKMPKDGIYELHDVTCGPDSGCEVGNRLQSCTSYAKKKCAVYDYQPVDDEHERAYLTKMTMKQVVELLQE
jgi:hypothetical protein